MPYLSPHGTMKPPLGAQIDPAHPLGQDACVVVPFHEGCGLPSVLRGVDPLALGGIPPSLRLVPIGAPTWNSNREGVTGRCGTTADAWYLGVTGSAKWVPQAAITIAFIRRKLDATNRNTPIFTCNSVATWSGTASCMVICPYSTGTVFWDFGGTSGANRLTVAGLSFSTTIPERWIFTAGPAGSAIWRDGIKLASQATAITRTVETGSGTPAINYGDALSNADVQEFNFLQVSARQWSDEVCRWWSAEPYAHLYPRPMTFVGSSHGKGRLPAGIVGATAPSAAASGTGPLLTTVGVG